MNKKYSIYKILERDVFTGRFRQIYETNNPNKHLLNKKFQWGGLKGKTKYKVVKIK